MKCFHPCVCGAQARTLSREQHTSITLEELPTAWKISMSFTFRHHWLEMLLFIKAALLPPLLGKRLSEKEAAIWGSTPVNSFLFWKLLTFLWFFQHDSRPSAPIRISGLTCFHTLLPFDCSLPTGSALPAWRQIEGKKGMKGALLMLLLPAESSGWNARRSHAGTLGRIVGCGVMWVGAHDFLSSSHLQCSKLLCRKLLLAASLPSAAPPQGRCAPWCTGETSLHRAGLPPLHSLPSFALWFSPLPCNPLSCFKNVKGSVPFLDSRSLRYYYYLPFCSFKTKCLVFCRAERERERSWRDNSQFRH